MARQTWSASGREIWRPDAITVGTFRLLPELSPLENLGRLITVQASIWLNKYKIWSYDRSDIEMIEQDFRTRIFLTFRQRVWDGEYDRRFTLYQNVRSVAWSVCSNCIRNFKRWIEQRNDAIPTELIIHGTEGDELTLGDTLTENDIAKQYTDRERRQAYDAKRRVPKSNDPVYLKRREAMMRYVSKMQREDEYHDYLGQCDVYGIDPISYEEFVQRNYN